MTVSRTMILTAAAVLLAAGPLSAAEGPQHAKGQNHKYRLYRSPGNASAHRNKGAVQYGNNTRDNSYGGVYGEYAPQPQ